MVDFTEGLFMGPVSQRIPLLSCPGWLFSRVLSSGFWPSLSIYHIQRHTMRVYLLLTKFGINVPRTSHKKEQITKPVLCPLKNYSLLFLQS